ASERGRAQTAWIMRWGRLSTALRLGCTIRDRLFVAPASRPRYENGRPDPSLRSGFRQRPPALLTPAKAHPLKRLNLLIPLTSVKIMVCLSLPEATLGSEETRKGA